MKNLRNLEIYSVQNNIILRFLLIISKKRNFVGLILEIMGNTLTVILIAVAAVGFFILAMSLTLIFKGHHIDSEISTNKDMQRLGIKCAVQETREDMAAENCEDSLCSGNCAGCDIEHSTQNEK